MNPLTIAVRHIIVYLLHVTPTHRDTGGFRDRSDDIRDDEKQVSLTDLPVIIQKILGLTCALFLALLSASPKLPGFGADSAFVISTSVALTMCVAWACWFETFMYEKLTRAGIWIVLILAITGVLIHFIDVDNVPYLGMPIGLFALILAIAFTSIFVSRRMLYPRLEFFLPATAILSLWAVTNVL